VLVIDYTGFLKKGRDSAGVARQYRGTAGCLENGPTGVVLGYASQRGPTLLDRERYLPQAWTNERERCRQAGLPDDRRVATAPERARQMLARACTTGLPAQWVTGERVESDDRRLRLWLASQPQASGLTVSGKEYVWVDGQQRLVTTRLAALPQDGWRRLRAGAGAKGPRWDDWRWLPLAEPIDPLGRRGLWIRRSLNDPMELRASGILALQDTTREAVVRVAGTRWSIA
jgi:SRSO17 transposase